MDYFTISQNTIPVSDARSKLGKLVTQLKDEPYVLTKRGRPEAVLVNANYWDRVMANLKKITRQTYIQPELLPYTREFSNQEIRDWEKEDRP